MQKYKKSNKTQRQNLTILLNQSEENRCKIDQSLYSSKEYDQFMADTALISIAEFHQQLKDNKILYHSHLFFDKITIKIRSEKAQGRIVFLQANLSYFTFIISIYNDEHNARYIQDEKLVGKGNYSEVYKLQNNKQVVIKRIPFLAIKSEKMSIFNISQIKSDLRNIIKEYCIGKLASTLKLGPKILFEFGFDLIVHQDCVEFTMEHCEQLERLTDIKTLKSGLKLLHNFKIVHSDIKRDNIMLSKTYGKPVFIDFNCSQAITEVPGQKTHTRFKGTYNYASPEMKKIYFTSTARIDLYNNDIYGLQYAHKNWKDQPTLKKRIKSNKLWNFDQQVTKLYYLHLQLRGIYYEYNYVKLEEFLKDHQKQFKKPNQLKQKFEKYDWKDDEINKMYYTALSQMYVIKKETISICSDVSINFKVRQSRQLLSQFFAMKYQKIKRLPALGQYSQFDSHDYCSIITIYLAEDNRSQFRKQLAVQNQDLEISQLFNVLFSHCFFNNQRVQSHQFLSKMKLSNSADFQKNYYQLLITQPSTKVLEKALQLFIQKGIISIFSSKQIYKKMIEIDNYYQSGKIKNCCQPILQYTQNGEKINNFEAQTFSSMFFSLKGIFNLKNLQNFIKYVNNGQNNEQIHRLKLFQEKLVSILSYKFEFPQQQFLQMEQLCTNWSSTPYQTNFFLFILNLLKFCYLYEQDWDLKYLHPKSKQQIWIKLQQFLTQLNNNNENMILYFVTLKQKISQKKKKERQVSLNQFLEIPIYKYYFYKNILLNEIQDSISEHLASETCKPKLLQLLAFQNCPDCLIHISQRLFQTFLKNWGKMTKNEIDLLNILLPHSKKLFCTLNVQGKLLRKSQVQQFHLAYLRIMANLNLKDNTKLLSFEEWLRSQYKSKKTPVIYYEAKIYYYVLNSKYRQAIDLIEECFKENEFLYQWKIEKNFCSSLNLSSQLMNCSTFLKESKKLQIMENLINFLIKYSYYHKSIFSSGIIFQFNRYLFFQEDYYSILKLWNSCAITLQKDQRGSLIFYFMINEELVILISNSQTKLISFFAVIQTFLLDNLAQNSYHLIPLVFQSLEVLYSRPEGISTLVKSKFRSYIIKAIIFILRKIRQCPLFIAKRIKENFFIIISCIWQIIQAKNTKISQSFNFHYYNFIEQLNKANLIRHQNKIQIYKIKQYHEAIHTHSKLLLFNFRNNSAQYSIKSFEKICKDLNIRKNVKNNSSVAEFLIKKCRKMFNNKLELIYFETIQLVPKKYSLYFQKITNARKPVFLQSNIQIYKSLNQNSQYYGFHKPEDISSILFQIIFFYQGSLEIGICLPSKRIEYNGSDIIVNNQKIQKGYKNFKSGQSIVIQLKMQQFQISQEHHSNHTIQWISKPNQILAEHKFFYQNSIKYKIQQNQQEFQFLVFCCNTLKRSIIKTRKSSKGS